jgi:uncharacterized protein with FMN-binding domain
MSSIKKYIIAAVLVVAFVAYLIFANRNSTPITATPSFGAPTGTPNAVGPTSFPTTTLPTGNPPSSSPSTAASSGQYKNGTYTGVVADAFYGNLQAVAVIQNGALTDITFPQYPTNGHSGEVSNQALPVLKQEAIAAQSANVNVVSGATQDSQAFQQSLASALAQAKA